MPKRVVNQFLDKEVRNALWKNSKYFIEVLGEPNEEGNELIFPINSLPFISFKIRYHIEEKFLGKIYGMVLEAKSFQREILCPSGIVELRFSGFIKKGNAFFILIPLKKKSNTNNANRVLQILNGEQYLIEQCSKLDCEFLRLFFNSQEKVLKTELRPYGGSLIHLQFPPMRYNVDLVNEQAVLILSIMKKIAELIN